MTISRDISDFCWNLCASFPKQTQTVVLVFLTFNFSIMRACHKQKNNETWQRSRVGTFLVCILIERFELKVDHRVTLYKHQWEYMSLNIKINQLTSITDLFSYDSKYTHECEERKMLRNLVTTTEIQFQYHDDIIVIFPM